MASAKKVEIFDFPIEQIYAVISDFSKYPEFLPEVKAAKVLKSTGKKRTVQLSVSMMKDFTYTIIASLDEPNGLSWVFESGDVFKSNTGSWKLKAISPTQTQVTYEVSADFKLFVPGPIAKKLIAVSLPKMLETYKARVAEVHAV